MISGMVSSELTYNEKFGTRATKKRSTIYFDSPVMSMMNFVDVMDFPELCKNVPVRTRTGVIPEMAFMMMTVCTMLYNYVLVCLLTYHAYVYDYLFLSRSRAIEIIGVLFLEISG